MLEKSKRSVASLGSAQASPSSDPTEVLKARTFADLLQPIPDAMARLEALDAAGSSVEKKVQTAQFIIEREHHHHHHHNSYYRRYREEPRVIVVPRDRGYGYRHHHHHHHHNSFYRRYRNDD